MFFTNNSKSSVDPRLLMSGWICCILFFSACVTQRDLHYLQNQADKAHPDNEQAYKASEPDGYYLKPGDDLVIQISSLDNATYFSALGSQQSSGMLRPYAEFAGNYSINREGYLFIPLIGNLQAQGKNVEEIGETIRVSLGNILNQPVVTISLANRFISVLGEVRNPGRYSFEKEGLTVFDALGLAGDITDYGNRNDISVIRNDKGMNHVFALNLTDPAILGTEYYYIQPNDIVYVKPLKKKFWSFQQVPYAIILSTISTSLFFYSVFN